MEADGLENPRYLFLSGSFPEVKSKAFFMPPLYMFERRGSFVRTEGGCAPQGYLGAYANVSGAVLALAGLVQPLWLNRCRTLTVGGIKGVRMGGGDSFPVRSNERGFHSNI